MDSRKHAKFTGSKCTISRRVGGKFIISEGYIKGENVVLVPDRMIVQRWRPDEDCWPADHHSTVTFQLDAVEVGTKLVFTQSGVPVDCGDRFDTGWREYYWGPMKEMLESEKDQD